MHKYNETKDAYKQYLNDTTDLTKLSIMLNMVTKDLHFRQLPSLKVTCEKCGRLHSEQLISIDPAKNLFLVSSVDDEY